MEAVLRRAAKPLLATAVVVLGLVGPRPAGAQQTFVGQVVEEDTGRPVATAFVQVLDERGERVVAGLTDPEGRFRLRAEGAGGAYTLTADRIGYGTAESEPMEVAAGEVRDVTLVLPTVAIRLEGIEATEVRRCELGSEEALGILEAWEEARKTLEILAWTEEEELFRFRTRNYERLYPVATGRLEEERTWTTGPVSRPPFASVSAEELAEEGYVRRGPVVETFDYFGPDAEAVLSRVFLETHCFRLLDAARSPSGLMGLAFEPSERRDVPDISGVLWLDEETKELRHLEFEYTRHLIALGVPRWLHPVFGGRVDFRELPNGAWVVDRWFLQMPEPQGHELAVIRDWGPVRLAAQRMLEARSLRPDVQIASEDQIPARDRDVVPLLAVKEEGGELAALETAEGLQLLSTDLAVLEGTAFDSTRMAPLSGARVELGGTEYRVVADRSGRFQIAEPTEGLYELRLRHSRLDQVGMPPLTEEVELVRGEVRQVELAVPSRATLYALTCEREPGQGQDGAVAGRVLDPLAGAPVPDARVELLPRDEEGARPLTVRSAEDGTFLFCSVPASVEYGLLVQAFGVVEDHGTVRVAAGEVRALDVEPASTEEGVLRGLVREGEDGAPIAGARLVLDGRTRRTLTSDDEGRFELSDLPVGVYSVRVDRAGYRGVSRDVTIHGGERVVDMEVRLLPEAIAMEPMVVTVESTRPTFGALVEVYDRMDRMRQLGLGRILDRREIEEAGAARVSHLVSGMAGVRSRPIPGSSNLRLTLNHRQCEPSYYLDGLRLDIQTPEDEQGRFSIDEYVTILDVEVIEVYRQLSELPGELYDENSARCGALAVWTRRGG